MELDAIAPNVREDLSGNQDGDERVLEGDPSTQKCETDDHRDESDADTAQELSDERRLERDANRTNCDGVFGVRYRRDLIGTVLNGAQGAKFGRVVQQLELAALQNRPALLVVKRGRLTSLAGSSIERYGDVDHGCVVARRRTALSTSNNATVINVASQPPAQNSTARPARATVALVSSRSSIGRSDA